MARAAASAETWHAIYRTVDGELVSTTTVLPERLEAGLAVLELTEPPDWEATVWDAATRNLVTRPARAAAKDRVSEIIGDVSSDALLAGLTVVQRDRLAEIVAARLADPDVRYYRNG